MVVSGFANRLTAATAALYVTKSQKQDKDDKGQSNYPLDKDGKLSSASESRSTSAK